MEVTHSTASLATPTSKNPVPILCELRMRELKNMAARRLLCKLTPFRSLICREQNVSRFLRLQRPSLSHSVNMRLFHSSGAPLSDGTDSNDRTELQSEEGPTPPPPALTGRLHMTYTCKVCGRRSGREFSKQAYTGGVVLIQCPGCESLHLVADNLGWFNQKNRFTIMQSDIITRLQWNSSLRTHCDMRTLSFFMQLGNP